MFLGL